MRVLASQLVETFRNFAASSGVKSGSAVLAVTSAIFLLRRRHRRRSRWCEQGFERPERDERASTDVHHLELAVFYQCVDSRVAEAADLAGGRYRDGKRLEFIRGISAGICGPVRHAAKMAQHLPG
jgi:hypothetical protein